MFVYYQLVDFFSSFYLTFVVDNEENNCWILTLITTYGLATSSYNDIVSNKLTMDDLFV